MRKILFGAAVVTLGASAVFATGASAGGNGAARSGLSPQPGGSSNCVQGSGAGVNGFAILNAVGQPGATFKDVGEVSLKNAAANAVYTVWTSVAGSDSCMMQGTIETNGQGNGNAHIASTDLGSGTFYVVIKDSAMQEQFASGPLTVT